MKQDHPKSGIGLLCGLFGRTRHAYYDAMWRKEGCLVLEDVILQEVAALRRDLPRLGVRKLHHLLAPALLPHGIRIGRDYLFDLLSEHGMLVRRRKRRVFTTDSRHWMRKYSNLARGVAVTGPEQLWVSDITYIGTGVKWGYLSLVTDAHSRKIMGYCFRDDLSAEGCIAALRMALGNRVHGGTLMHHSDRGSQYCSHQYVELLVRNKVSISMTENGDPYENALAERVNGIIKTEFNLYNTGLGFEQTHDKVRKSIGAYNELRPHASCDYLTPNQAHMESVELAKRWKNYKRRKEDVGTAV